MNRYIKLVNFEINRFMKLYLVLLGLTIILQFTGVIFESLHYVHQANNAIYVQSMSKAQFLSEFGRLDFKSICQTIWFLAPVAISAVVILGYVFLIWYRDWFAKNTFIYRLLMLPTTRLNIYFSKATAILLLVLGLIALQIIMLPLQISLFEKLVPSDYRVDLPLTGVIANFFVLNTLIPGTVIQFLLYYGMGLMLVFVLFTSILLERSFGWKGLMLAVLYAAASCIVFLSPIIYMVTKSSTTILYPDELLELEIALGIIVIASAIFVSGFLLKKKITV